MTTINFHVPARETTWFGVAVLTATCLLTALSCNRSTA